MSNRFSITASVIKPALLCLLALMPLRVLAQNSYDMGAPAASKAGQSTASTYAMDKIETVNLANQNLSLRIPLVTMGGRGSASYTLTLSYNSKLWSAQHDQEPGYTDAYGVYVPPLSHHSATFDDAVMTEPNVAALGSGWTILQGPAIKVSTVQIDPISSAQCPNYGYIVPNCGYQYVLTRLWLVLPDGSQVELRDNLTDGAPALTPQGALDRDRGRVWHSTDGSGITYITDANNGAVNKQFAGWLFLADGTRLRFADIEYGGGGRCTAIIDRNGNFVTIDYGVANPYAMTYTDQLGRQVIMATSSSGLTITVKGYNGVADRVVTIDTAAIGALTNGVPTNLRADFRSLQRPFYSGDYLRTQQGDFPHTDTNAHTDLFEGSENPEAIDDAGAVTTLHLLDGRSFQFRYNQYGELAEIIYPGGGISQIDYSGFNSSFCEGGSAPFRNTLERRVVQRRALTDGVNTDAVWLYARGSASVDGVSYPTVAVEARQGSSTGTLLASETHYFLALDAEYRTCLPHHSNLTGYEKWQNAKEFRVERQTGSGTVIEKRTWEQRASVVWANDVGLSYNAYVAEHGQEQPPNDPRVVQEDTILENGKMKRVTFDHDNFNNVTLTKEYDFGDTSGSLGTLLRQTERSYGATIGSNYGISLNGVCYSNLDPSDSNCGSGVVSAANAPSIIYQRHLLLNETIKDGSGNQKAYSEFEYDNYSTATNHASLVVNSGMIQYDATQFSTFSSASQPRGNATKTSRWAGGSNYISAFAQYDNAGNVIWTKDPKGNVSTISYTDNFGSGSSPDSGSGGTNGATFGRPTLATNALGHQAYSQYDYTRAAPSGVKDPNGVIAKTEFDAIGRPVRVTAALGLSEQTISDVSYPTASANVAMSSTQLDANRWLSSKTVMDGFDRVVQSWQAEDGLYASSATFTIRADTVYDALGRVRQVSNPYRPGAGESAIYTTSAYDLAGRVISVTTPDSAVVSTSYSSNEVTVTDQAGKKRKSVTDGLGRLRKVIEDPTTGGFNYETDYDYDTLDNLITVTQGSQTRSFTYDPLKRLITATNPESGTVCYGTVVSSQCQSDGYDANGNLVYKTDARGVRTTYGYDALNRVISRGYSNDPANTPDVAYSYDRTITNGKGRLYSVSSSVSAYTYTSYDAPGRAKTASQAIYGQTNQTYAMSYSYDLAGHVNSMTYPSGHVVNYNYDNAGRLADADSTHLAFTGNLGDGATTPRTYSRGIIYDAAGRMTKEQFGTTTAIFNKLFYNSRGQLAEMRAGTTYTGPTDTGSERGAIINYYSDNCWGMCGGSNSTTAMTDNNGNLKKQQIEVPGSGGFAVQWFAYDSLNRLQAANEIWHNNSNNTDSEIWKQTYVYDRYGNRTINTNTSATYGGVNNLGFDVETGTNRLLGPGETNVAEASRSMRYDAAGNLWKDTYDGSAVTRAYDAENRMTSETQANNYVAGAYIYDGDGRRVKRNVGGVETWQVYGIGGELIAEYGANTVASSPEKEYGYRNGQLLITATVTTGWGSAPTLHDNPIQVGVTTVQALHITELRTAINALRSHLNLSAYSWTTSATTNDYITASPILEMRIALDQALGAPSGGYAAGLSQGQPIKAIHIQELRDRVLAAWVTTGSTDIRWLVSDQLGTPRMILDQSGSLGGMSRHDYLPFGEPLTIGDARSSFGYTNTDGTRQQFTQKERDNETGLDFFGARYYASMQGRFTSPDPLMASAYVENPQSWNRYSYALNNPLKYVDPDGMKSKPVFRDYKDLSDEERRILENSKVTVGKGNDAQTLSGQALYDYMKTNQQKQLATFLNQTAVLSSTTFCNGRSAISYVNSVTEFRQDRIIANVDAGFMEEVRAESSENASDKKYYVGPLGSGFFHGDFDTAFRENFGTNTSQQLSFNSKLKFAAADIDMDEECPDCGNLGSSIKHGGRVVAHRLFGGKTDPYGIYQRIVTQRKIQPNYIVEKEK